ncbi:hypothetical protein DVH05_014356 [Phytophthora capsici]|nr:hypothetical protein DVH05_014356 [Phytophthora capsici]
MSDSNFTQVLNIIAEAAGISRNLLGDEIWLTSHCFRRGGAQYRFMFAPEDRRWSLKLVKWWAGWAPSEKSETVTRYLLDDVLDREENQLGDSLAPDAVSCSSATLEGIRDIDYGSSQLLDDTTQDTQPTTESADAQENTETSNTELGELKSLLQGLHDMVKNISKIPRSTEEQLCDDDIESPAAGNLGPGPDTTTLVSELPDAKSWKDYVHQYWNANPDCHQYRAGVDMLSHERKVHRSRLSRMKIIAEFIREQYDDDQDKFEKHFTTFIGEELTVNKILAAIRKLHKRR